MRGEKWVQRKLWQRPGRLARMRDLIRISVCVVKYAWWKVSTTEVVAASPNAWFDKNKNVPCQMPRASRVAEPRAETRRTCIAFVFSDYCSACGWVRRVRSSHRTRTSPFPKHGIPPRTLPWSPVTAQVATCYLLIHFFIFSHVCCSFFFVTAQVATFCLFIHLTFFWCLLSNLFF